MVKLPILLPPGFVSVVKLNDYVKAGQVVAKKAARQEYVVAVSKNLSVSVDKARKCLRKNPGDAVTIGDVLAVRRGFLGLNEERIVARVEGTVLRYERDNGNLVIKAGGELDSRLRGNDKGEQGDDKGEAGEGETVVSPVDGIVSVCNNDSVVIGADKDFYLGTKGVGESATGEIFILEGGISLYYALDSRAVGKIIVGGDFSRELLTKSIGIGVIGIVGTNIVDADIEYLVRRNILAPIIEVDNTTIEKIIQWKGKKIYLNSPEKQLLLLRV
jgi:hypothetical protein